jgi:hypothetical protein
MAMINVDVVRGLADERTQFLDILHKFSLCDLCVLCG